MTKPKKEVADWRAGLVAAAKKTVETEKTGGTYISLKGGRMSMNDELLAGDKLDAIVLATIHERTLYERPYDPDDDGPPDCFAQGVNLQDLSPHSNVPSPVSSMCKGCPKAEFGTARQGKGPACKTHRKLALISVATEDFSAPEIATMRIPPTSVKNFSRYAAKVAGSTGLPPWAVETEVSVKPDSRTQFQVNFDSIKPVVGDEKLSQLFSLIEEAENMLMRPYEYDNEKKDSLEGTEGYAG